MREEVSNWLIVLAKLICKREVEKDMLKKDVYEPKQIAFATAYTKGDVRRKCKVEKISRRKAVKGIEDDCKAHNMKCVFGTAKRLLQHKVFKDGEDFVVETRLNVYVRKEE